MSAAGLVSRNPPTVGAGLRGNSALLDLARTGGWFAVNVLSVRQALVADWFANPERPTGKPQFEVVDWSADPDTGLPLLGGAVAHLICRVTGCVTVGDHELLLGVVDRGTSTEGTPLISLDGSLHGAELRCVTRRPARRGGIPADSVSWE